MRPTEQHVREWLLQLGGRISPSMRPEEYAARISMLCEDLADSFDAEVFSRASMLDVAKRFGRIWPSFGEICEVLQPFVVAERERRYFLALPPPAPERREPYDPGPAPDWCFEREPRHLGRVGLDELKIQKPIRSVDQQLAELRRMLDSDKASA